MKTHPSLNEILQRSSESVRRLNPGTVPEVPRNPRVKTKKAKSLDAGLQHAQPKPKPGPTLEQVLQAQDSGEKLTTPRPVVHFTLYRVHLLDGDNKIASIKFILDALRVAGIIPNDRECDIQLIVDQQRVPHFHQEGTGVSISYPG